MRPITAAPLWALALLFIATFAITSPAAAQIAPPEAAAPAEPEPAPEAPASDPAEAPAETAPPLAAALTDPAVSADELSLLLIPLTVDQLAALAGEWLTIVQAKTQEVVEQQIRINRTAAESVEQAARDQLTALTEERRALFDRYSPATRPPSPPSAPTAARSSSRRRGTPTGAPSSPRPSPGPPRVTAACRSR